MRESERRYFQTDQVSVSRGQLIPEQIERLNEVLAHHGIDGSRLAFDVPECLVKACLVCGSIAEAPDVETRDCVVDNFDQTCCGLTVVFHSANRVLVDPSKLTIRPAQNNTD